MTEIISYFESAEDTPLTAPGNVPTIRIRRTDTQALVVTDSVMTEQGDGNFSFDFTPVDGLEYSVRADGDPTAAGQTLGGGRFRFGSMSGTTEARIETDIPAILVDTATTIPGLIAALNNLAIADVQTAMTNQGYTAARALLLDNLDATISSVTAAIAAQNDLSIADVQTALTNQGYTSVRALLLDNLDASVSSRATVASILAAVLTSTDTVDVALSRLDNIDSDVVAILVDTSTTIPAQISALNDLAIADVQTALTNQGYTAARALLLDNLDATISSIVTAIGALNDLSIADVQTALTNQGYTSVRAALLDNLDAAISSRATVASILAAVLTSGDTINAALSRLDNIDADVAAVLVDTDTTIPLLIAALNDLSIVDVQTAMTSQGYTAARAPNLDNLDATISSVITAISGLNDVSIVDVQTAMTNQGYTAARAVLLDNLVTILATVEKIRKVTTNRVVVNAGDTQVDVYEDNDVTIAFSFTISGDRRTRTPI